MAKERTREINEKELKVISLFTKDKKRVCEIAKETGIKYQTVFKYVREYRLAPDTFYERLRRIGEEIADLLESNAASLYIRYARGNVNGRDC